MQSSIDDETESDNREVITAQTPYDWFSLGFHERDNNKKIEYYTKTIELDPRQALAYNNRGLCYKNLGQYNKAIRDHKKAIEVSPDYAAAYYNLGISYWELRKWNKVIEAWVKCLEIDPDHENARTWLPKAKEAAKPKIITIKRKTKVHK